MEVVTPFFSLSLQFAAGQAALPSSRCRNRYNSNATAGKTTGFSIRTFERVVAGVSHYTFNNALTCSDWKPISSLKDSLLRSDDGRRRHPACDQPWWDHRRDAVIHHAQKRINLGAQAPWCMSIISVTRVHILQPDTPHLHTNPHYIQYMSSIGTVK